MSNTMNPKELNIHHGDILRLVDFGEHRGSEQSGKRPCIVISNDVCNYFSPTITVLPITKVTGKTNIPTHVFISKQDYDIKEDSLILAEQIFTVDKRNILGGVIGTLNPEDMQKTMKAITTQLDIDGHIKKSLPQDKTKLKTKPKYEGNQKAEPKIS